MKPEYVEENKKFASDVIVIPHSFLEWIRLESMLIKAKKAKVSEEKNEKAVLVTLFGKKSDQLSVAVKCYLSRITLE